MEQAMDRIKNQLDAKTRELDELQDKYDLLMSEKFKGADDAAQRFEARRVELEEKFTADRAAWEYESQQKSYAMETELSSVRAALQGDPGGWRELTDKSGSPYFQNNLTGETAWEKPMLLTVAQFVVQQREATANAGEVDKARRKLEAAEDEKRRLAGRDQERTVELNDLRKVRRDWTDASRNVRDRCTYFHSFFDGEMQKLQRGAADKLEGQIERVRSTAIKIEAFRENQVAAWMKELAHWKREAQRALAGEDRVKAKLTRVEKELSDLKSNLVAAAEELAKPYKDAASAADDRANRTNALRRVDLEYLAALWPAEHGFSYPSVLLPYRTIDDKEKARLAEEAREVEKFRAKQCEIIESVARRALWSKVVDEHGAPFYFNKTTGEASWNPPVEYLYQVPKGWDAQGHKLPRGESPGIAAKAAVKEAEAIERWGGWLRELDDNGYVVFRNLISGTKSWRKPRELIELEKAAGVPGALGEVLETAEGDKSKDQTQGSGINGEVAEGGLGEIKSGDSAAVAPPAIPTSLGKSAKKGRGKGSKREVEGVGETVKDEVDDENAVRKAAALALRFLITTDARAAEKRKEEVVKKRKTAVAARSRATAAVVAAETAANQTGRGKKAAAEEAAAVAAAAIGAAEAAELEASKRESDISLAGETEGERYRRHMEKLSDIAFGSSFDSGESVGALNGAAAGGATDGDSETEDTPDSDSESEGGAAAMTSGDNDVIAASIARREERRHKRDEVLRRREEHRRRHPKRSEIQIRIELTRFSVEERVLRRRLEAVLAHCSRLSHAMLEAGFEEKYGKAARAAARRKIRADKAAAQKALAEVIARAAGRSPKPNEDGPSPMMTTASGATSVGSSEAPSVSSESKRSNARRFKGVFNLGTRPKALARAGLLKKSAPISGVSGTGFAKSQTFLEKLKGRWFQFGGLVRKKKTAAAVERGATSADGSPVGAAPTAITTDHGSSASPGELLPGVEVGEETGAEGGSNGEEERQEESASRGKDEEYSGEDKVDGEDAEGSLGDESRAVEGELVNMTEGMDRNTETETEKGSISGTSGGVLDTAAVTKAEKLAKLAALKKSSEAAQTKLKATEDIKAKKAAKAAEEKKARLAALKGRASIAPASIAAKAAVQTSKKKQEDADRAAAVARAAELAAAEAAVKYMEDEGRSDRLARLKAVAPAVAKPTVHFSGDPKYILAPKSDPTAVTKPDLSDLKDSSSVDTLLTSVNAIAESAIAEAIVEPDSQPLGDPVLLERLRLRTRLIAFTKLRQGWEAAHRPLPYCRTNMPAGRVALASASVTAASARSVWSHGTESSASAAPLPVPVSVSVENGNGALKLVELLPLDTPLLGEPQLGLLTSSPQSQPPAAALLGGGPLAGSAKPRPATFGGENFRLPQQLSTEQVQRPKTSPASKHYFEGVAVDDPFGLLDARSVNLGSGAAPWAEEAGEKNRLPVVPRMFELARREEGEELARREYNGELLRARAEGSDAARSHLRLVRDVLAAGAAAEERRCARDESLVEGRRRRQVQYAAAAAALEREVAEASVEAAGECGGAGWWWAGDALGWVMYDADCIADSDRRLGRTTAGTDETLGLGQQRWGGHSGSAEERRESLIEFGAEATAGGRSAFSSEYVATADSWGKPRPYVSFEVDGLSEQMGVSPLSSRHAEDSGPDFREQQDFGQLLGPEGDGWIESAVTSFAGALPAGAGAAHMPYDVYMRQFAHEHEEEADVVANETSLEDAADAVTAPVRVFPIRRDVAPGIARLLAGGGMRRTVDASAPDTSQGSALARARAAAFSRIRMLPSRVETERRLEWQRWADSDGPWSGVVGLDYSLTRLGADGIQNWRSARLGIGSGLALEVDEGAEGAMLAFKDVHTSALDRAWNEWDPIRRASLDEHAKLKSWLRSELTNSQAWTSAAELRPEDQEVAKLASFAMVAANKAKFEEKARRMTLPGYIEGGSDDEEELTNTSGASGRLNYRAFDVTVAVLAARAEFEQVCGQAAPRPTPPTEPIESVYSGPTMPLAARPPQRVVTVDEATGTPKTVMVQSPELTPVELQQLFDAITSGHFDGRIVELPLEPEKRFLTAAGYAAKLEAEAASVSAMAGESGGIRKLLSFFKGDKKATQNSEAVSGAVHDAGAADSRDALVQDNNHSEASAPEPTHIVIEATPRRLPGGPSGMAAADFKRAVDLRIATLNARRESDHAAYQTQLAKFLEDESDWRAVELKRACREADCECTLEKALAKQRWFEYVAAASRARSQYLQEHLDVVEHSAEKMFTAEQGAKLARSRQALEAVRGDRAIEQLSADLASFLRRLDMARTAPRRARNPIEREWLEQEFAAKLPDWAEEQALILAALHREGRRLRALMAEQWTSVRAEAIRLKEERRLFEDARIMADLVNDQCVAALASRARLVGVEILELQAGSEARKARLRTQADKDEEANNPERHRRMRAKAAREARDNRRTAVSETAPVDSVDTASRKLLTLQTGERHRRGRGDKSSEAVDIFSRGPSPSLSVEDIFSALERIVSAASGSLQQVAIEADAEEKRLAKVVSANRLLLERENRWRHQSSGLSLSLLLPPEPSLDLPSARQLGMPSLPAVPGLLLERKESTPALVTGANTCFGNAKADNQTLANETEGRGSVGFSGPLNYTGSLVAPHSTDLPSLFQSSLLSSMPSLPVSPPFLRLMGEEVESEIIGRGGPEVAAAARAETEWISSDGTALLVRDAEERERERKAIDHAMFCIQREFAMVARNSEQCMRQLVEARKLQPEATAVAARELAALRSAWEVSLKGLKEMVVGKRDEAPRLKIEYEAKLVAMRTECDKELATLRSEAAEAAEALARRDKWVVFMRAELKDERRQHQVTRNKLNSMHRRWKKELDAVRCQLRMERQRTSRLELWVFAMQHDINTLKTVVAKQEREKKWIAEREVREMRGLQKEIWRHATTAAHIGSDPDALFLFFTQRLANLAGVSRRVNDTLYGNGAAAVAAALAQSPRYEVKRLAVKALGWMGWNGSQNFRLVRWDCLTGWKQWMDIVTSAVEYKLKTRGLEFWQEEEADREVVSEEQEEELYRARLDEVLGLRDVEESEQASWKRSQERSHARSFMKESMRGGRKGRAKKYKALHEERRRYALRNSKQSEAPHRLNQAAIGHLPGVLAGLIKMAEGEDDWEVRRNVACALSIAAADGESRERMGAFEGCISSCVQLCTVADLETQKYAATTLANLAFASRPNQERIGAAGGIQMLLSLSLQSLSCDVLESCTLALANCMADTDANAEAFIQGNGVEIMLDLLRSPRSADPLAPYQVDDVHANAAEAIANATRLVGAEAVRRFASAGVMGGWTRSINASSVLFNLATDSVSFSVPLVNNFEAGSVLSKNTLRKSDGGEEFSQRSSFGVPTTLDSDIQEDVYNATARWRSGSGLVFPLRGSQGFGLAPKQTAIGDGLVEGPVAGANVRALVLLAGSHNIQVKRHSAIAIGNIVQSDVLRKIAGEVGAVEAMFRVAETQDAQAQANACWALTNLCWSTENQERVGRYLDQLFSLCISSHIPVQENALQALSNALFFQIHNRRRLCWLRVLALRLVPHESGNTVLGGIAATLAGDEASADKHREPREATPRMLSATHPQSEDAGAALFAARHARSQWRPLPGGKLLVRYVAGLNDSEFGVAAAVESSEMARAVSLSSGVPPVVLSSEGSEEAGSPPRLNSSRWEQAWDSGAVWRAGPPGMSERGISAWGQEPGEGATDALGGFLLEEFGAEEEALRYLLLLAAEASGCSARSRIAALRCLCSASHDDAVALRLGFAGGGKLFVELCAETQAVETRRLAVYTLNNIATRDELKRGLLQLGALEAAVQLQGVDDREVRSAAEELVALLSDLPKEEELHRSRVSIGVEGTVRLLMTSRDPAVLRMAAEGIAEEAFSKPWKRAEVLKAGALSGLLSVLRDEAEQVSSGTVPLLDPSLSTCAAEGDRSVLIPALWAVRNLSHDNPTAKVDAGRRGAVDLLIALLRTLIGRGSSGRAGDQELCEAVLGCALSLSQDCESNCRRIIADGLDVVLDLAESGLHYVPDRSQEGSVGHTGTLFEADEARDMAEAQTELLLGPLGRGPRRAAAISQSANLLEASQNNQELAKGLLLVLKPYNWIRCSRCGLKQASGSSCRQCGSKIQFQVSDEDRGAHQSSGARLAVAPAGSGQPFMREPTKNSHARAPFVSLTSDELEIPQSKVKFKKSAARITS